jgi:hypothetical protein
VATKRLAHFNVVAAFDGLDRAVAAVERLQAEGVPDGELSLLGPEHEMRPGSSEPTEAHATGSSGLAKSALAGVGAGAATGGVLGVLAGVGAAAIPGIGLAVGAGALYGAVSGAAVGHIAGGLIGAEVGARKSMMWEQTLNPIMSKVEEGYVLVGVHTDEVARADHAEETLADLEPVEAARLDADESYRPPGDFAAIAGRDIPSGDPDSPGGELGHDRAEYPDAKLVGMEERGETPTRGGDEDDAPER